MKRAVRAYREMSGFYRLLPLSSQLKLYVAIFFTFAPLAILCVSNITGQRAWYEVGVWMACSGLIAVGWAVSLMRNLKYLWLVIPGQLLIIILLPNWQPSADYASTHFSAEGIGLVSVIILGCIFFISFLNGEGARRLKLQAEIDLARRIHARLVPPLSLTTPRLEVYGKSVPCIETGGDLIDMVETDGKVGLYIADVSGHGVQAGVLMSMVKSAMRMKLLHSDALESLCRDLNRIFLQIDTPEFFVTLASMQFNNSSTVSYSLAGHPPILHYHRESRTLRELANQHPPLGVVPNNNFSVRTLDAVSGDLFVLFTDGLIEVVGEYDNDDGLERIAALIRKHDDQPLPQLYKTIMTAVQACGPQGDDQTLMLVRVR